MSINKIVYDSTVLIDLTDDTVTKDVLLSGYTAHAADGTTVTGTLLNDYPDEFILSDYIFDSDGDQILDSDGDSMTGRIVYRKI